MKGYLKFHNSQGTSFIINAAMIKKAEEYLGFSETVNSLITFCDGTTEYVTEDILTIESMLKEVD